MHWGYLLCLILYFDLFVAYYSTVVELFMRARARVHTHHRVCGLNEKLKKTKLAREHLSSNNNRIVSVRGKFLTPNINCLIPS